MNTNYRSNRLPYEVYSEDMNCEAMNIEARFRFSADAFAFASKLALDNDDDSIIVVDGEAVGKPVTWRAKKRTQNKVT